MKDKETIENPNHYDDGSIERLKQMGTPKRRRLEPGESVPIPGYEFLGVHITGEGIEVLEFEEGEISPVIPNPVGLAKAVFSLIVLNLHNPFTHHHLRYVRRHMGMTQEKLADRICVRRQTVVDYENNKQRFDKAVELAVRFIALPTALNYLPAHIRRELKDPLHALQDMYSHLDELVVSVEEIRNSLKDLGLIRIRVDKESTCCL